MSLSQTHIVLLISLFFTSCWFIFWFTYVAISCLHSGGTMNAMNQSNCTKYAVKKFKKTRAHSRYITKKSKIKLWQNIIFADHDYIYWSGNNITTNIEILHTALHIRKNGRKFIFCPSKSKCIKFNHNSNTIHKLYFKNIQIPFQNSLRIL